MGGGVISKKGHVGRRIILYICIELNVGVYEEDLLCVWSYQ